MGRNSKERKRERKSREREGRERRGGEKEGEKKRRERVKGLRHGCPGERPSGSCHFYSAKIARCSKCASSTVTH